jgi:hypothetical protein
MKAGSVIAAVTTAAKKSLDFQPHFNDTFNMTENTTTGWPEVWNTDEPKDDNLTPEQAFDILFGYAEERHRNDPCARPAPKPKH